MATITSASARTWIAQMVAAKAICLSVVQAMKRCRCRYISTAEAALVKPKMSAATMGQGGPLPGEVCSRMVKTIGIMTKRAATPEKDPGTMASASHPKRVLGVPTFRMSGSAHSGQIGVWMSRRS